ncbi:MAG: saccharopine dehydrogenase NADP-binding domain-containing protein [Planctomycetes bacterium]|nr:saccharopine dehydrogenase NADP-binding domain-containing protein [Planctomycetota bacterium]
MNTIVVLGAGKIGRMVAHLLVHSGDYLVRIGDSDRGSIDRITTTLGRAEARVVDFGSDADLDGVLEGATAVVSCAPFHCNPRIAERARAAKVHYFDLTEDVAVTRRISELAEGAECAFVPQCGLAPGFITICAVHLIEDMTDVHDLRMRVGALPRYPTNMLRYNLTWSTEGLINEYCHPCEAIVDGELVELPPMQNLESLIVDGVEYEAFNTSGGLGTLAATLRGRVRNVDYKSVRYPGHNTLMNFLLRDLRLQDRRDLLKEIFEAALPTTVQDQIVVFVSATGTWRGRLTERTYARTIYHQEIDGHHWSGIQVTTAAGVCAAVDLLINGRLPDRGFVRQEQISYRDFVANRFGRYYA